MNISGDHSAVFIPKGTEAQECLRTFNNPTITNSEKVWLENYLAGEFEADETLVKNNVIQHHEYELYEIPLHDVKKTKHQTELGYSTYLKRAIVAKGNIGVATNDGWIFNMILDCYVKYAQQHNYQYQVTEKSSKKNMMRLSPSETNELSFSYVRALQTFVVEGIKHTS